MAVAGAFRKGRAVPRPQYRLSVIFAEDQFPLHHIDKLILVTVPVPLAGPAAWRQGHQVDAEIAKAARIAQTTTRARTARRVKGRRIAGALVRRHGCDFDLWHGASLAASGSREL